MSGLRSKGLKNPELAEARLTDLLAPVVREMRRLGLERLTVRDRGDRADVEAWGNGKRREIGT